MANSAFNSYSYSVLKKHVQLYAVVTIGSSGACTLKQWSPTSAGVAGAYTAAGTTAGPFSPAGTQGVAGIVRHSAGLYTITLQNPFQRLLGLRVTQISSTGIPTAPIVGVLSTGTDVTTSTGGTIKFQFSAAQSSSVTTLTATDPASGDTLLIEIDLDDSQVA